MKPLPVPLVIALLSLGLCACGSGKSASQRAHTATAAGSTATSASNEPAPIDYTKVDGDKDNDIGNGVNDDKINEVLGQGHPASAADKRAITALIKRYYAAGAAGDGAAACSMLYITLAEAAVEDYGHGSAGPSYLSQGTSCPSIMDLLFKHFHSQLTAELPLLKVRSVGLDQRHGTAVLSFGKLPERQISVREQRHAWKLDALQDSELP